MSTGGMPLLSGPPPDYRENEPSCRKCDKEFNVLFARARKCNHCGYSYCHSCTDFQALMPRHGSETGYDPVPVCAFCIDNLTVTAGGKSHLKLLPLARLKKYANAYNIKVNGVLEKDDLINALISVRGRNGCLPHTNEDFYRKYSVPNRRTNRPRGVFARAMDAVGSSPPNAPPRQQQRPQQQQPPPQYQPRQRTTSGPSTFPRPDLEGRRQTEATHAYGHHPPPPPRDHSYHAPPPRPQATSGRSNLNVPNPNAGQYRGRARAASASSPTTPRTQSPAPPVPTLDQLIEMPENDIARLSIGTLKAVLFHNHVNARLVVEKAELVAKVWTLIKDERRERERHAAMEAAESAAEEEARREAAEERSAAEERREAREHVERAQDDASAVDVDIADEEQAEAHAQTLDAAPPPPPPKPATSPSPATGPLPRGPQLERTGLCVICQDEEANIVIVDCGHLCLCRSCSDLIMKGTRECPLCRTRIVTEQRLLRIFKT
ncbi:hypothetical protein C8Q72DRAFT_826276 [Fomitopsis betulina]|nr:hypothetical protein C8Q72DRAFT_826276 [Fomitopsis betulina]